MEGTELSAVATVFGTPELLEAILLHVNVRTLLLSQRVHSSFRSAIQTTKRLQQKLFFRPLAPSERYPCSEQRCADMACRLPSHASSHRNPLLSDIVVNAIDGTSWRKLAFFDGNLSVIEPGVATSMVALHPGKWMEMLISQPGYKQTIVFWRGRNFKSDWEMEGPKTVVDVLAHYCPSSHEKLIGAVFPSGDGEEVVSSEDEEWTCGTDDGDEGSSDDEELRSGGSWRRLWPVEG